MEQEECPGETAAQVGLGVEGDDSVRVYMCVRMCVRRENVVCSL